MTKKQLQAVVGEIGEAHVILEEHDDHLEVREGHLHLDEHEFGNSTDHFLVDAPGHAPQAFAYDRIVRVYEPTELWHTPDE